MKHRLALAVGLVLSSLVYAGGAVAAPSAKTTTQLPRTVNPLHYAITVTPDAADRSFKGSVVIDVEVLKDTKTIVMNQANLKVTDATWYVVNPLARVIPRKPKITHDEKAQTLSLTLDDPAVPGKYQLAMEYTGTINTQANGLFSLDYDDAEGKKRGLFTQFENSDARRFVPSWDEPSYKATFDLTAIVPASQMAVSNMPIAETNELEGGLKGVRFATTPKMSTYLLFFGLGDFERATTMADGVEIGVVTPKGKVDQAKLALDGSAKVLKAYNEYFATPFPLPKLDNVAGPGGSQFFSAMENWGAIFTFEHTLLIDPVVSTTAAKQRVFGVAAHEIAHQWFGNLVTMDWWDDLWLNEGFATWMAGRFTEKMHPEWDTRLNRVGRRDGAISMDAVASTHPVVTPIKDVDQASQAFDGITYSKGGSVITMLEHYVGEENWRNGVRAYMKKHAYGNTKSDDLWSAIQATAGKPVLDIAHDFTLKPGVPLVKIASAQCVNGKTKLALTQGEYTLDHPDKKPLTWRLPVAANTLGNKPQWVVMQDRKANMTLNGCGPVQLDQGQTGYYRIAYSDAQLKGLSAQFNKLDPIDQLGLISNQRGVVMANLASLGSLYDLAEKVPVDAKPALLNEKISTISGLYQLFAQERTIGPRAAKYGRAALAPLMQRLGWSQTAGENENIPGVRSRVISNLAWMGDPEVLAMAKKLFDNDIDGSEPLKGDAKNVVWSIVADRADEATWNQIRKAALAEKTPLVKSQLLNYLASASDEALARKALAMAISEDVGATEGAAMISRVASEHPELAFDFAAANVAKVNALVDTTSQYRFYPRLLMGSDKIESIAKLQAFADKHIPATARRETGVAINAIKVKAAMNARMRKQASEWLKSKGY